MFRNSSAHDVPLVERAICGDQEAFGKLVRAYSPVVFSIALAHLRNNADAEDVSQDAFLKAYRSLAALRSPAKFGPWLVMLTKNLCYDALRKRGRDTSLSQRAHLQPSSTTPHPEQEELHAILLREMGALDDTAREAIVLHYFAHKTVPETAALLGLSKAATAKRIQRARTALGDRLLSVTGDAILREDASEKRTRRAMAAIAATTPSIHTFTGTAASGGAAATAKGIAGVLTANKFAALAAVALVGLASLLWSIPRDSAPEKEQVVLAAPADTSSQTEKPVPQPTYPATVSAPAPPPESESKTAPPLAIGEIADPAKYCTLSGRTLTRAGEPVPGAEVVLACSATPPGEYRNGGVEQIKRSFDRSHQYRAVSDNEGKYSMEGIRYVGYSRITAQAQGFLLGGERVELQEGMRNADLDIILDNDAVLVQGRVLSPSGLPVEDAAIRCLPEQSMFCYSNARGEFSLLCSHYCTVIQVYEPRYGFATFAELYDGKLQDYLELRLPGTATVRGRIIDSDGTPAASASVQLTGSVPVGKGGSRFLDLNYSVTTSPDGRYEVLDVDSGQQFDAKVYDAEGTYRWRKLLGYLPANHVTDWDVNISNPITIRGTIRGRKNHQPVTAPNNLRVAAVKDGQEVAEVGGYNSKIVNGAYELDIPGGAGRYLIVPTYEPFASGGFEYQGREVNLEEGVDQTVDLELPDPYTMSVRAVDENGTPLKGAVVDREGVSSGFIGVTGEDGRFTYDGFMPVDNTPGTPEVNVVISMKISYPGMFPAESTSHSGSPGQVFPEETVVLYPEGEIVGYVTASDGTPAANQKFYVLAKYGSGTQTFLDLLTDSTGRFRLKIPCTPMALETNPNVSEQPGSFRLEDIQCPPGKTLDIGNIVFEPIAPPSPEETKQIADSGEIEAS